MEWGDHTLIVNLQYKNSPFPQIVLVLKVCFLVGRLHMYKTQWKTWWTGQWPPDPAEQTCSILDSANLRMRSYVEALLWPLEDAWVQFHGMFEISAIYNDTRLCFTLTSGSSFIILLLSFPVLIWFTFSLCVCVCVCEMLFKAFTMCDYSKWH